MTDEAKTASVADWNDLPSITPPPTAPEIKSSTPPEPVKQEDGKPVGGEAGEDEVETEEVEGEDEEVEEVTEDGDAEPEETPTESKEPTGKIKTYKATRSDGEIVEIADDTTIKIKADGNFVKVKFRDLKDHFAANKTSERIMAEAINERKAIERDIEGFRTYTKNLNQIMGGVKQAIGAKDVFGILENVAYLANAEPEEFIGGMIESFSKFYTDISTMSPEQRDTYVTTRKLDIEKKRIGAERQSLTTQKQIEQVNKQIEEAEKTFGVTKAEMKDAFTALARKTGDVNSVKLDQVLGIVIGGRVLDNMNNACKELGLELPIEDKEKIYRALYAEEAQGDSVEYEEYVRILKGVAGKKAQQSELSRKVQKKKPVTTPKREQANQTGKISSWDDL